MAYVSRPSRSDARSYIKNLAAELEAIAASHPGKTLQLWCEDEAREGQKGRTGHRSFTCGERPPGRCGKRFLSTYIFAAVRPGTDDAFAPPVASPPSASQSEREERWCCPKRER